MNGNVLNAWKAFGAVAPPAVMIAILGFMGNGVVSNDKVNTAQHTEIRKEMIEGDVKTHENIHNVQTIVTDIRLEQTEQKVLLREIRAKL